MDKTPYKIVATLTIEPAQLKSDLYKLAAEMARRQGMPTPEEWEGWALNSFTKLWHSANQAANVADAQCRDWADRLAVIARSIHYDETNQDTAQNSK